MIDIMIDGRGISAGHGDTILKAAGSAGIKIPTLCHHEGLRPDGNCRLCTVEVKERGRSKLVASCMYPIRSAVEVDTCGERVMRARRFVIQMLINRNPKAIMINELAEEYGVTREERFAYDSDLCVRCNRCVRACEANGTNAIGMALKGFKRYVASPYDAPSENCVGCASCAEVCPTGKITFRDSGGVRGIWGRSFALVACGRCGARFATEEQIAHVAGLGAGDNAGRGESAAFCERCRKAVYGERFK
ncbi:MAG: 2Fe-2S iron-sulfur cluster-binding protein [Synergistaceae bacterium]|nr:2Fe-2S iron-sulfur cluster-binding protein [Synergistaceae bacterium]